LCLAFPDAFRIVADDLHGGLGDRRAGFVRNASYHVSAQIAGHRDLQSLDHVENALQCPGVVIDLQFPRR